LLAYSFRVSFEQVDLISRRRKHLFGREAEFRSKSLSGAEEPNVCMPSLAPVAPT
jgi:hypothetical protein